jgi:hypothetical protein
MSIYKINQQKQLIDLNGQSVNFDLNFSVVSKNGEPFDVLVVDQATLDSENVLEYKKSDQGRISGSVVSDKNIYQNYFLVLKAEKPCEVYITIDKKEIEAQHYKEPVQQQYRQPPIQEYYNPVQPYQDQRVNQKIVETNESNTNWRFIFAVIFLVMGIGAVYYFFYKKKKTKVFDTSKLINNVPFVVDEKINEFPNITVDVPLTLPLVPDTASQSLIPNIPDSLIPESVIPDIPSQSLIPNIPESVIPEPPVTYNSALLERLNKLKI